MKRLHRRGGTASLPVSIRLGPNPHWLWSGRRRCPISKGFRKGQRAGEGAREWGQGERPYPKGQRLSRPARRPGFAMLSLFQRKRVPPATSAPTPKPSAEPGKGLMRPEPAASLLATPRRQKLLEHIWQRTSLSRRQFATLYLAPLERYAELVQQFPASEAHHHAYPGGMLDHGLEIVAYALKLRQSHLLPAGATPEAQAAQAEAWTAGTAYAALLHDIGKIAVDLHVEYADGTVWHPGTARCGGRTASATAGARIPAAQRRHRAALRPAARSGHLRLARRLSRPLGRAAVRAGRPVRACRHARRTGRAGGPGIGRPGTRRRSEQGPGSAPARTAAQAARWPALPPEGRVR